MFFIEIHCVFIKLLKTNQIVTNFVTIWRLSWYFTDQTLSKQFNLFTSPRQTTQPCLGASWELDMLSGFWNWLVRHVGQLQGRFGNDQTKSSRPCKAARHHINPLMAPYMSWIRWCWFVGLDPGSRSIKVENIYNYRDGQDVVINKMHWLVSRQPRHTKSSDQGSSSSAAISMEVTVGDLTVVITDYKPKTKRKRLSTESQNSRESSIHTDNTSSPELTSSTSRVLDWDDFLDLGLIFFQTWSWL